MGEMIANARVVWVCMRCDKCGKGYMKLHNGVTLATYPPQYPHKCDNCGHVEKYNATYPHPEYLITEQFREPTSEEREWYTR